MNDMNHIVGEKIASDPNETREAYVARSIAEGLIISLPEPNELQIDIDNQAHRDAFNRSFEILSREIGGEITVTETVSKSGTGAHIRITLPFALDVWQRIAWQAALGSDPVREVLSCLRAMRKDAHPTLMAEKPDYKK
jgi:hypothetical protein